MSSASEPGVTVRSHSELVPHRFADSSRKNEARFRFLAEAAFEAIAVHRNGRIIDCNDAMERLVAMNRTQIIGSQSLSLVAPESRELATQHIHDRTEAMYELFLVRPDGERRAVEVRGRYIDMDGKPSLVVAMRDITERIAVEKELRHRQTLLDETQTFAHVGSWELDLDSGIMKGTAETRRLLSLNENEAATQESLIRHTHPEDRATMRDALKLAVTQGSATVETRIVRHDGSIRWLLTQKQVRRNDAGRPTRIVGISQDVTERRLREDTAIESRRRLASFLDNLSDVFYSLDATTHEVLMISRACEQLYGLPAKSFYDNPRQWVDVVHPEDAARVRDAEELSRQGTAQDVRYRIRRADGAIRSVRDRMTPLVGPEGAVMRIEGYVSDVTAEGQVDLQRAKMKELEAVAAFKTDLLNAASHELNTPLAAMKLQLYLHRITLGTRATPGDTKSLDVMDRNATRLATLINETLDVSRIQSKTLRLNKAPMALDETADQAIEQLAPVATQAGVILESIHDGTVRLTGDALRLSQVVFNLVGNALKFVPRGGRITVVTSVDGVLAHCAVKDSGSGLRPDQIAKLFQAFTQVHDVSEPRGGTGLGLFISRGIVEDHGGRIWCESPGVGKGSTFHFEVPIQATDPVAVRTPMVTRGSTAGRVSSPSDVEPTADPGGSGNRAQ